MIGGEHRDLGDRLEGVAGDAGGERPSRGVGLADEVGVGDLARQVDAEPIGGIVAVEIGGALRLRPVGERLGELVLGGGDAAVAGDLAVAAGDHRLGLVVERAQELALPAVPHPRTDRLDVGDGEDQEHLQPVEVLHGRGEVENGLAVGKVARLRRDAHQEMMLDQPGDGLGLRRGQPEARPEPAGDARAGDRVVLRCGPWRCRGGRGRRRGRRGP